MHIQGTAYRGAWGVSQSLDPTTFIVPTDPVDMTVSLDDGTPIGTATLTQDTDGTITADCEIDDVYRRWTRTRPFLSVALDDGNPQTVLYAGIVAASDDPDLPEWTEVTP